jgi:DNA-binding NarL/FixJ family response regulator
VARAKIRVLIASGERLACDALGSALRAAGFLVVAEVYDAPSAVERVEAEAPDVAVVSVDLLPPGRHGAFEPLISGKATPLLLVSFGVREPDLLLARRVGASGFLSKSATLEQLIEAIRAIVAGRYIPPTVTGSDIVDATSHRRGAREGVSALTSREREVLSLIAEGMSSKEIAVTYRISVRTAEATGGT